VLGVLGLEPTPGLSHSELCAYFTCAPSCDAE
jgi:hypothetical protein